MELREYWEILRRRWWVVIGLTALALLTSVYSVGFGPQKVSSYEVKMSLSIKPEEEPRSTSFYTYSEYYAYVASEYLADDMMEIIQSGAFMEQVLDQVGDWPHGRPSASVQAKKSHRVLEIIVTSAEAAEALAIARGIAELLMTQTDVYVGKLSSQKVEVFLIDPPRVVGGGVASRAYLEIGLRAVLGLLAGLGLAFLLEYFDDRVRGAKELEREIGLLVLAEIPAEEGRLIARPGKGSQSKSRSSPSAAGP